MARDPTDKQELRGGRYVLLGTLGQGSQGTTWDAVDKREGRAVAVKAFDVRGARSWKDVELAEREARVLSELRHPLLPRYIEHFEEDGTLYLVMAKIHGTPLSLLKSTGRLFREKDLTRLLQDADQVLTYLHGRDPPVIHRDVKPSNVIRQTDGSFAFVDFGAVRDHLRPEGGSTVVGTFGYMAPEQFQGRAGPASDVYAVGATAIAMLTGKEPEKLPHRGLTVDVAAALGPSFDPRLRDVLVRMLEPDPDTRPTRIGPLLDRAFSSPPAGPRSAPREAPDGRHGRRVARQIAGGGRRRPRDDWQRRGHVRLPFFLRLPFGVLLTVAQIAVVLVLEVALPFALTLLSLVFGRSLRSASRNVAAVGGHLSDSLVSARRSVRHGWDPSPDPRASPTRASEVRHAGVRVDAPAASRQGPRVSSPATSRPGVRVGSSSGRGAADGTSPRGDDRDPEYDAYGANAEEGNADDEPGATKKQSSR